MQTRDSQDIQDSLDRIRMDVVAVGGFADINPWDSDGNFGVTWQWDDPAVNINGTWARQEIPTGRVFLFSVGYNRAHTSIDRDYALLRSIGVAGNFVGYYDEGQKTIAKWFMMVLGPKMRPSTAQQPIAAAQIRQVLKADIVIGLREPDFTEVFETNEAELAKMGWLPSLLYSIDLYEQAAMIREARGEVGEYLFEDATTTPGQWYALRVEFPEDTMLPARMDVIEVLESTDGAIIGEPLRGVSALVSDFEVFQGDNWMIFDFKSEGSIDLTAVGNSLRSAFGSGVSVNLWYNKWYLANNGMMDIATKINEIADSSVSSGESALDTLDKLLGILTKALKAIPYLVIAAGVGVLGWIGWRAFTAIQERRRTA